MRAAASRGAPLSYAAIEALGYIGDRSVTYLLLQIASGERAGCDDWERMLALLALARMKEPTAAGVWIKALQDQDAFIRDAGARALVLCGFAPAEAVEPLLAIAGDSLASAGERASALLAHSRAYGRSDKMVPVAVEAIGAHDERLRLAGVELALSQRLEAPEVLAALFALSNAQEAQEARAAIAASLALASRGNAAAAFLRDIARGDGPDANRARSRLADIPGPGYAVLADLLKDPNVSSTTKADIFMLVENMPACQDAQTAFADVILADVRDQALLAYSLSAAANLRLEGAELAKATAAVALSPSIGPLTRAKAIDLLKQMHALPKEVVRKLLPLRDDPDPDVREAYMKAFGKVL